jgi:hypothetical protein
MASKVQTLRISSIILVIINLLFEAIMFTFCSFVNPYLKRAFSRRLLGFLKRGN